MDSWMDGSEDPEALRETRRLTTGTPNSQALAKTYMRAVNLHIDTVDMTTTADSVSVG